MVLESISIGLRQERSGRRGGLAGGTLASGGCLTAEMEGVPADMKTTAFKAGGVGNTRKESTGKGKDFKYSRKKERKHTDQHTNKG